MIEKNIPMDVFTKGRNYGDVLEEYRRIYNGANKAAREKGGTDEEIFSNTLMASAYRIYLLGVEDGMKGAQE